MILALSFFKKKPLNWLSGYPVYEQPFTAAACKLTGAQADANFEYFAAHKDLRINALSSLLTGFDIDIHAGLSSASPDTLVTQLYQWSGEHWPQYFDKGIHSNKHWIASTRQDANLIYSLITDTAIVIGELIIKQRPTYSWNLDRDADNKLMASYNRVVLTARWLPEPDKLIVVDVEAEIAKRFLDANYIRQKRDALWLKLVKECVSGGAEGAFLNY